MLCRIAENDRFRTFLRLSVQVCVLSVLPVPRRPGRVSHFAEQNSGRLSPSLRSSPSRLRRSRSQPTRGRAASDVRRPSRSRRAVPLGVLASSPSALAARSRPRRVTRARRPPLFVIIYPRARAKGRHRKAPPRPALGAPRVAAACRPGRAPRRVSRRVSRSTRASGARRGASARASALARHPPPAASSSRAASSREDLSLIHI